MDPQSSPRPPSSTELAQLVYDELRRLAARFLDHERPDHTLQPTALVNEAWLRIADLDRIAITSRAQFVGIAAGTMRRVLVDSARAKRADKRGGAWRRVTLTGVSGQAGSARLDLIALDEALDRLARLDERAARVLELRFFGGVSVEQTAEILDVGTATVKRKWEFARVWLRRELGDDEVPA